jgi:hypothetical protein
VVTKNNAVDFSVASKAPEAPRAELDYFHRPTKRQYDSSDRQVLIGKCPSLANWTEVAVSPLC